MSKRKVDRYGVHLFGCECKECSKTNAVCPDCKTKYWAEPDMPEYEECHKCGWQPQREALCQA